MYKKKVVGQGVDAKIINIKLYIPWPISEIMNHEKYYHLLALTRASHVGDVLAKILIRHCGSAEAVFKEPRKNLLKIEGVGPSLVAALANQSLFNRTENELRFIDENAIEMVSFYDNHYPDNLKECFDAPLILFKKGRVNLNHQRIISIVGTRQITGYGKDFLLGFIKDLKAYDPLIVSGLAYGVDIMAHQQALKHTIQTVGVLAHGLDRIYPFVHHKEARKMQENGGLLTDFWSGTNPDRENFVKRNRIVAGLSQATLVIESADKGGSLITADIANSYNRDVFALPGRVSDAFSTGCNNLIKTNRASLLTSAKDLAYILNWKASDEDRYQPVQRKLLLDMPSDQQKIYNYLIQEGKQQLDLIALHCNFPIHKTARALLTLELNSAIRPLPGKYFEAI